MPDNTPQNVNPNRSCSFSVSGITTIQAATLPYCETLVIGEPQRNGQCDLPHQIPSYKEYKFTNDFCEGECIGSIYFSGVVGGGGRLDVLCSHENDFSIDHSKFETCVCSVSENNMASNFYANVSSQKTIKVLTKNIKKTSEHEKFIDSFLRSEHKILHYIDVTQELTLVERESGQPVVLKSNNYTKVTPKNGEGYQLLLELVLEKDTHSQSVKFSFPKT